MGVNVSFENPNLEDCLTEFFVKQNGNGCADLPLLETYHGVQ